MTLSPMQRGYVTRVELNALKSYMDDGFELTNEHIDNLEKNMSTQFKSVNERIDNVEKKVDTLEIKMDDKFAEQKEGIAYLTEMVTKIGDDTAQLTKIVTKIAAKIL